MWKGYKEKQQREKGVETVNMPVGALFPNHGRDSASAFFFCFPFVATFLQLHVL
jgi:hypothetical protein